jgi:cobalt-zinc-cadmium efflux system membrane fusion protein
MKSIHGRGILNAASLVLILALAAGGCGQPESAEGTAGDDAAGDHAGHAHADQSADRRADRGHDGHDHAGAGHGEWCAEHDIAEAACPFCNPGLVESLGWCAGHAVPEALCYRCNPDLVAAFRAVGDWCAAHERPESQCYVCNPTFAPDAAGAPSAPAAVADAASEAGAAGEGGSTAANQAPAALDAIPRTQRPPSVSCTKQSLTVTLARPGITEEAGLEIAEVRSLPVTRTLECNATVAYDGNRYAELAPQVPGVVATVERDLGDRVEPGDVLATITSPAFGAAKATYLQAAAAVALWERNHARETDLLARGVATERDLLEAETRLAESRIALSRAEQELLGLGLDSAQVAAVAGRGDTTAGYRVTAAFSGVVVERRAVVGEVVDPSQPLFAVADVDRMWALLDVYEADISEVAPGQTVVMHVEGLAGRPFAGEITWVSSSLDPRTRTLRARAEFENTGGLLRSNMFARAVVTVRDREPTLLVPREAVQWEGCCNVVFVRQSETVYKPRKVHLGPPNGAFYEVRGGIGAGELVVTQGSFLLKTEILKGNIGAGCCEVQPGS